MIEEIEALKKNDTWELITLPRGKRTVGCRWVYTLKHKADGSIERARIVAKGFTQTYSINYLETFAPVAKLNSLNSIRVILSVAANRSWPLHQLDVKRAFLHGDLHQGFGGGRESLQVKKGDIWSQAVSSGLVRDMKFGYDEDRRVSREAMLIIPCS